MNSPISTDNTSDDFGPRGEEPLLVPAYRLLEAFEQNGLRARREWSGKLVQVSGRISSIGGVLTPCVSLLVENNEKKFEGFLSCDVSDIEAVMSLNTNDMMEVVGRVYDTTLHAKLIDCQFTFCEPPVIIEKLDMDRPSIENTYKHDDPIPTTDRWIAELGMVVVAVLACFAVVSDWEFSSETDAPSASTPTSPYLIENYEARDLGELSDDEVRDDYEQSHDLTRLYMIQTEREVREPECARDQAAAGNTLISKADLLDALPGVIMAAVTGPFGGSFLARNPNCTRYSPLYSHEHKSLGR